ncbi:hypothetical protein KIPB_001656 [Kipferlia bialata]|uniref:Uncharacterized protein n=1 Tax=Kipferlia bialata TaxID=797122 RepID=A0A391NIW1_9EUKA|nr:hypothetical protein KIPB_001656 [Kipferlia bialata]|eukprot:g1656.t1
MPAPMGDAMFGVDLSQQLSQQLETNNQLLSQLASVEEQQLRTQEELKQRQQYLHQSQQELNQSRRELSHHQRDMSRFVEEIEYLRAENTGLREHVARARQAEAGEERSKATMEGENRSMKKELEELRSSNERMGRQLAELNTQQESHSRATDARERELTQDNTRLAEEVNRLRSDLSALRVGASSLEEKEAKLQTQVEDLQRRLTTEKAAGNEASTRVRALESNETQLAARLSRAENDLSRYQGEASHAGEKLAVVSVELDEARRHAQQASSALALRGREIDQLRSLLEQTRVEMGNGKRVSDATQVSLERGLEETRREAQARLRLAEDELHRQAARHEAEGAEVRAEAEAKVQRATVQLETLTKQYQTLTGEHARLHDLLRRVQQEKTDALAAAEEEKEGQEERMRQSLRTLRQSEQELRERELEAKDRLAGVHADRNSLANRYTEEAESHIQGICTAQERVQGVLAQAQDEGARLQTVAACLSGLRQEIDVVKASCAAEMESVSTELRSTHKELVRAQADAQRLGDLVVSAEQGLKEERQRSRFLEDHCSQLEKRVQEGQALVETADQRVSDGMSERLRKAQARLDEAQDEVKRCVGEAVDLRHQLEVANEQKYALQEEVSKHGQEMAEVKRRLKEQMRNLEDQTEAMKARYNAVRDKSDQFSSEKKVLESVHAEQAETVARLQSEVRVLKERVGGREQSEAQAGAAYKQQVVSLTQSLKRYQAQLQQTQGLLAVVQEQRATLQARLGQMTQPMADTGMGMGDQTSPVSPSMRAAPTPPSARATRDQVGDSRALPSHRVSVPSPYGMPSGMGSRYGDTQPMAGASDREALPPKEGTSWEDRYPPTGSSAFGQRSLVGDRSMRPSYSNYRDPGSAGANPAGSNPRQSPFPTFSVDQ